MASEKEDKLEQKKRELEVELHRIQDELDNSIDEVRHDVSDKLDPKSFVRRYPLPVVGGALLLGFLVGHNDQRPTPTSSKDSGGGFSATLLYELKRLATKKALNFATDFAERKFDEKTSGLMGGDNGEAEQE